MSKTNPQLIAAGAVVIGGLHAKAIPNLSLIPEDQHIHDNLLDRAISIAHIAHYNQTRAGEPYIGHPLAVAEMLPRRYKVLGVLHDVMEDNPNEFPLVRMQTQFPPWVVERLVVLTKLPDEPYDEYLLRILATRDEAVWETKKADLRHNMSTLQRGSKLDKYRLTYRMLGGTP